MPVSEGRGGAGDGRRDDINRDWIVCRIVCRDGTHGEDAYAVECKRCGAKQRFALPISISVYVAAAIAFGRQHAHCKPKKKAKVPT